MNNLFVVPAAKEAKAMSPPATSMTRAGADTTQQDTFNRALNKASKKAAWGNDLESHSKEPPMRDKLKITQDGNPDDNPEELHVQSCSQLENPQKVEVNPLLGLSIAVDDLLSLPVAKVGYPEQQIAQDSIDSSVDGNEVSFHGDAKIKTISESGQKAIMETFMKIGDQQETVKLHATDAPVVKVESTQAVKPAKDPSGSVLPNIQTDQGMDQSSQDVVFKTTSKPNHLDQEGAKNSQEQSKKHSLSSDGLNTKQAKVDIETNNQKASEGKVVVGEYKDIQVQKSVVSKASHDPPPISATASGTHRIEPARLAEAQQPQVVEQISKGIETLTRTGQGSIRLELHPENLGKIDLRLATSGDGVRIVIKADLPLTSQLLERHLPELRQILVQAGVNIADVTVGYGSPNHHAGNGDLPRFSGRPRSDHLTNDTVDAPIDYTENKINLSLSQVDCRV